MSVIIQNMVDLNTQKARRKQAKNDVVAAHKNYQLTGLHVTHDEADNWLAELAEGKESTKPKCHK